MPSISHGDSNNMRQPEALVLSKQGNNGKDLETLKKGAPGAETQTTQEGLNSCPLEMKLILPLLAKVLWKYLLPPV